MVDLLVQHGADINATTRNGETIFGTVLYSTRTALVSKLLTRTSASAHPVQIVDCRDAIYDK